MRIIRGLLLPLLVAPLAFALQPRLTFERTVPAPHDLGHAESIAILSALGDSSQIDSFLLIFEEKVNDSRLLRVRDSTRKGFVILKDTVDAATAEKLKRAEPADIYLGVRNFTCLAETKSGEVSAYDADRNRVKRKQSWIDARCSAKIDIIDAKNVRRVATFTVKGEGTSPRAEQPTDDERSIALEQATRLAAREAAEKITPRRVREAIPLEPDAPAFDEGMLMISSSRLADARAIWEKALGKQPRSAPLRFNLAAVCEALGDRAAAEQHYTAARELAPGERRYSDQLQLFMRRR
ncbi:MAG TPA: tetratricopeptide repeat protein [Thermoanaerobaculia bacterium]